MKHHSSRILLFDLLMINAFVYISSSFYGSFLSPYYSARGISSLEIGILLTIGPISSILIQPLWAMISDRTGRIKAVLALVTLGSAVSMFSYYLGSTFIMYFIASLLLSVFSTSIIPLSNAIIIREAERINYSFSQIRMGGTIGYSISVVIAGIINKNNPDIMFFMGFIGYMLLFLFVMGLPADEITLRNAGSGTSVVKSSVRDVFDIFQSNTAYLILVYALISQLGLSFNGSFLGMFIRDAGYGHDILGWMNSASALSEIPILLLIMRLIKKFGSIRILTISCIILSLRMLIVSIGTLPFILLAQILQGMSSMAIYFSCVIYISENVKPGKQALGQSTLAFTQLGLGSIIGNIAGGYLVDILGIRNTFILISVATMLITAALSAVRWYIIRRKKPCCN
jgi:PPP family 3-phenylpropionic acid transporter